MTIDTVNIFKQTKPRCSLNGYLRFEFDRTSGLIILVPCCGITPKILEPPFAYEPDYLINNFKTVLRNWETYNMFDLNKYYNGNCLMVLHSNNQAKQLCNCYGYNHKIMVVENSISRNCNYHCVMCEERREKSNYEESLYIKLNDLFAEYIHDDITINTTCVGEPFLYKQELYKLIESRKKWRNSTVSILTNGSLLNDEDINYLDKNRKYVTIAMSIDALDKDVYESIRIGGNFDKVQDVLIKLANKKLLWHVNYVVQKHNRHIALRDYDILKNQLNIPIVEMIVDGHDIENNYPVIKDIINISNGHMLNHSH